MGHTGTILSTPHARAAERVPAQIHAKLIFLQWSDEQPLPVVLHDLSLDGAGLYCERELPENLQVLLQLPPHNGRTLTLPAHVVQSRPTEPGRHRISLRFNPHESTAVERLRDLLPL